MGYYNVGVEVIGETAKLVKEVKSNLGAAIGFYDDIYVKPFITLFNFPAEENRLEEIDNRIQSVAHTIEPFELSIKDHDAFYQHKTIYLPFEQQSEKLFTNIRKKFSEALKDKIADEEMSYDKHIHPHITIASKLSKEQFKKAITYFENKTYASTFHVPHFVLRKHGMHDVLNTVNYEVQKAYGLANKNLTLF